MNCPDVEELEESQKYRLIKTLRHDEIISFVFTYIKKRNPATVLFYLIHSLLVGMLLYFLIVNAFLQFVPWKSVLVQAGIAILTGFTIIIPLHEGIHALIYKLLGAKNIRFGADIKNMVFYATAHKYVTPAFKFIPVALSPFLLILVGCIYFAIYGGAGVLFFSFTLIIVHGTMCVGDFSLISFYAEHSHKIIYTFDDTENKVSYFYEYIPSSE